MFKQGRGSLLRECFGRNGMFDGVEFRSQKTLYPGDIVLKNPGGSLIGGKLLNLFVNKLPHGPSQFVRRAIIHLIRIDWTQIEWIVVTQFRCITIGPKLSGQQIVANRLQTIFGLRISVVEMTQGVHAI